MLLAAVFHISGFRWLGCFKWLAHFLVAGCQALQLRKQVSRSQALGNGWGGRILSGALVYRTILELY